MKQLDRLSMSNPGRRKRTPGIPRTPPTTFLSAVFCCGLLATAVEARTPKVNVKAAAVIDADTGRVLFEKSATTPLPVASTQKLLTALLMVEDGNLDQFIEIERIDTVVEPTRLNVRAGDRYTRRQLVQAMLVKSCNDIAHALGRDYSGSESEFAIAMTERAKLLGAERSVFKNASGLPSKGQYSTAIDMAKIARAAFHRPVIRDIVLVPRLTFHFNDGRQGTLVNTNKLLQRFKGCTGMKTGYTRAAGRCLVSSATRHGRNVIVVVLGCSPSTIWQHSTTLLEYGLDQLTEENRTRPARAVAAK